MRLLQAVVLLLFLPLLAMGQTYGSKGTWHVQSAKTLNPGRLELRTDMNFYTKVGNFLGTNKPADFKAVNYWLVQGNALLTYGLMKHVDGTLMIQTYQDVHGEKEANVPGDIFLDLKTGGWELRSPKLNFAALLQLRFPTGSERNYDFEEYAAPTTTAGLSFALSYFNDPYLTDRDISVHFNVGYRLYNDSGKEILKRGSTSYFASQNATAFTYGAAVIFPTNLFDLTLGLHGLAFGNQPDSVVYGRENFMYITPGIKVKPFAWMAFNMGVDLRLSSDKDESADFIARETIDLPNYASWKFRMGFDFTLMPVVSFTKSRTEVEREELGRKVEFFEEIIQERQKAEKIEEELQKLRKQREEAESELEELRQLLEESGGQ